MKHILSLLAFSIATHFAIGQDYKAQFDQLSQAGDTTKQFELLQKWEAEFPKNPELYTSYFNYYFLKSRKEVVSMSTKAPVGEAIEMKDSSGRVTGYIGSEIVYDRAIMNLGFEKIDKGIKLHPNRLDMRFGKIYAYSQLEDWDGYTQEIVRAIQYSKKNDNKWTWTNDQKKEDGKDFLLSSIQNYQIMLFNSELDALLVHMRTIANELLKLYPDHVESYTNIAISYILKKDYQKGIESLLKAEKIDPKDPVVLSNIAHGYKLNGEIENSKKYYQKMLKLDDPASVAYAQEQLDALTNK